ncbi:putative nucleotidyltransferase with HDIG domain [Enterococcus sp. PF1-24]|uniref:HD family phosphohydrolase n=1 Tax=unclassified Enterococcus TaxID=2608891 RepID=UPI002472EE12|nr:MULTISPECIES: HDIG domain-containing metalloprotein [unclassified Enterococcus]MDH6365115.1 putative nucleotidyltransferase with HDIG domain [Enterococcus sp. PFB1-1]MDH6402216.1 putative nucleotidyltransferase with HDIG domain [Enterococcus sp. PF1-24]
MLGKILLQYRQKMGRFFFPVIYGLFALFLLLIMYGSVEPKTVNYSEGQVAEESIRANKTIENVTATEQKRKLASEAVTPEYTYQEDLAKEQQEKVQKLFDLIEETNLQINETYEKEKANAKGNETIPQPTLDGRIAALKKTFESSTDEQINFYQNLPATFYESVFSLTDDELQELEELTISKLSETMSSRIRENDLATIRQETLGQLESIELTDIQRQAITDLLDSSIIANEFLNEKRTEEMRKEAMDAVQSVMIFQGEVIVREGNQIDAIALDKLALLGMTNRSPSVFPVVALVLAIALQLVVLIYFSRQLDEERRISFVVFYVFTMILSVSLIKLFQVFDTDDLTNIPLFFPAAFTPLVLSFFVNRRAGIISALFQALFAMFIHYQSAGTNLLTVVIMIYAFSGLLAAVVKRERIVEQGFSAAMWVIIFPMIMIITLVVYQGMSFEESSTWMTLVCGFVGCSLSYLFTMGLHPYIEQLLNDDSVLALNELSNPNHPLLKQLLEEAPGTYHHSMMVANLSANAVAEIGGKSLLTRVACYYHDIGKIKHANFFVENLPSGAENPHNFLLPEDSKQIIFGHVIDGAKILEEAGMPQMVVDICYQHHGTTLMSFFYVKAKERNPEVKEEDFRYPGPKPQCKEAGVVSIADSCEAAVRAMDNPTNEKIEEFVHQLIEKRILDGQLDESGLTLGEIRQVEKSLINGLASTFHSRIKYPKMKSEAEQMKKEQERSED